jgi:hypothetical protein
LIYSSHYDGILIEQQDLDEENSSSDEDDVETDCRRRDFDIQRQALMENLIGQILIVRMTFTAYKHL